MPTSIKQLKVINNATLADDGTFSIGLRDNLIIKPNAKVGLSKFLYEEQLPLYSAINLQATSYNLTTQLDGTLFARKTLPRKVAIQGGAYANIYDLMLQMNFEANSVLVCGDKTGQQTFNKYVVQNALEPAIDAGLDIVYQITDDAQVEFIHNSGKIQMCVNESTNNTNMFSAMSIIETFDSRGDLGLYANTTEFWWGYNDGGETIKGAIQSYIQITEQGIAGQDWSWGFRYMEDAVNNNGVVPRMGIYKDIDNTYHLVDRGVITPATIGYTWASGDFMILFSATGDLYLQIYSGDPLGNGISGNAVGALKYTSPPFSLYREVLKQPEIQFRMVINSCDLGVITPIEDPLPTFRQIYNTYRQYTEGVPSPNGIKRVIQMDLTGAGQLSNQFGLTQSKLTSPKYEVQTIFIGTQTPNFYRVQDISLFWSLPAHTYVGNQTKTRNSRENLVASFTPARQLESTNNLFYQEEICYTDIGNLDTLNISTIQFRVVNEYPNGNTKINTNYLAFTLFIKEEYENKPLKN